jgi:Subtilase family
MRRYRAWEPTRGSHLIVTLKEGADPRALQEAAARLRVKAHLLFSHSRERLLDEARSCARARQVVPPDLTLEYRVRVQPKRMREVAARLREVGEAAAAYIMPAVALPADICRRLKARKDPPPVWTPSFAGRQGHLKSADEGGVDAIHARDTWGLPGQGKDVQIIHVEGAWNAAHEDLVQNQGGVLGSQIEDYCARQHGTAVWGVLGADAGGSGVTGICPEAFLRAMAVSWDVDPDLTELPATIRRAANALPAGDIILIEIQHPGPPSFGLNIRRVGFIPPEWWPATFKAIKYATSKGVIVVEAAGNGRKNLGADVYDDGDGFAQTWKNPFKRATDSSDSGAILVGAGAPPPEPHGTGIPSGEYGPDRSRLDFSNYGPPVDVQAWGHEVTTCGYGSLQGGEGQENRWYTDEFGGTSSAAPIVAGVLACVQGVLRAKGVSPLTPAEARALLRTTGTPQTDHPDRPATERIGRRPDLKELIPAALALRS